MEWRWGRAKWLTSTSLLLLFIWIGWHALHPSLPAPGRPAKLYANQCRDDLRLLFRRAIESADTSIYLMIYNFTDETLLRLLEKRAREGVEVVVLTGAKEARRLRKRMPSTHLIGRKIKGLMHQKVLVVDGHAVWIGSTNWTPTSLRMHSNLLIGMECEALARELQMSAVSRGVTPPPLAQRSFWCGGQEIEYWQLPTDEGALDRIIDLIEGAESEIQVAMFTWTHPKLAESIIAASQRGVLVQVVLDAYAAHGSSRKIAERLEEEGVALRVSMGPELLHHKFMWIDQKKLVTGSANWTRAAFATNEDAFVVLTSLTKGQVRKMRRVWRAAWVEAT